MFPVFFTHCLNIFDLIRFGVVTFFLRFVLGVLASGTPERFCQAHPRLPHIHTPAISRDVLSLGTATPGSRVYGRLTRYFRPLFENSTAISVGAAKIRPLFPLDGLLWPGGSRPKASGRRRCGLQWWTVKQHVGPINS